MRWCVFVTLAVVVAAVKAQDYNYDDDLWDWRSDEDDADNDTDNQDIEKVEPSDTIYDVYPDEKEDNDVNLSDDQTLLKEDNENINKDENIAADESIISSIQEEDKNNEDDSVNPDEDKALVEEKSYSNEHVPIEDLRESLVGENNSNENVLFEDFRAEDKKIDQLVQEQINQVEKDLDDPNSAIAETFDDYQIEDNRPDKGDLPSNQNINNMPSDSDGSFETKDYETDPLDGFDMGLSHPKFGGDLDSKEVSPDNHNSIADANKLLSEENGLSEEKKENNNKNEENALTDSIEEKNDESKGNKNKDDSLGELDEDSQEDLAVEDIEQMLVSETGKNNIEIESVNQKTQNLNALGELDEDSQEDTAVEDLEHKYNNDMANEDNKDVSEDPANNESFENDNEPQFSFVNDMINPENTRDEVSNSDDDPDTNVEVGETNNSDIEEEEEDTVDKAYKDLNADLEKLFATWDKLTSDDSDDEEEVSYEDLEEDGISSRDDLQRERMVLRDREALDKYIDEHGADNSLENSPDDKVEYYDDENIFAADTNVDVSDKQSELPEKDVEDVLETKVETTESNIVEMENVTEANTMKTVSVSELSPEQYNGLMTQFAIVHASELDTQAENFGKYIAAVHITLSAEEATEITSPNFPNTYPTNNVLDWILEGDGMGIELNITDLAIRGVQGDFLLVKPGGLDETGPEGLIFSYQLNEPRLYRFTDVSRVFVRFQSGPGLGFLKGFRMTVKNIWPPEYHNPEEELPEPEPLLPSPTATITVHLAGISVFDFSSLKPDFQRIIADMATMYINSNSIDAGLNSTSETAQLTTVSSCKANWPNFENCVAVTFGVPLVYEEEDNDDDKEINKRLNETDLQDMWSRYVNRDPFAARLRALGISEFEAPDDRHVIAVWMVLAVGIVISAAMVAFAMWRYSCFEDYTRMKSYSDTDSIADQKRGLDLYPTPHQTLPPLYAEQDYKWADAKYDDTTRVDLGGFANRSFARDELVDIYSDEDTAVQRNRFTTDV